VGEFGTDGVDATNVDPTGVPNSQALKLLKMFKGKLIATLYDAKLGFNDEKHLSNSGWNQLQQEDFKLNILYTRSFAFKLYYTIRNAIDPFHFKC
jgi:hypothetical protein